MKKIRVLIVDDAVVVRRIVSDVLGEDPDIEVAGVAANGNIALSKIPQINPDLVTLDIEMPELNGLQTLAEIRKVYPKLPVIMFSTLTERGASETLEALSLGATDYVTKPANVGSVNIAMSRVREELIPKIKNLCSHIIGFSQPSTPHITKAPPPRMYSPKTDKPRPTLSQRVDLVAIGVSTGGPNALADLLPEIPANFPVPIVIVQHMPEYFTKLLADRLTSKSQLIIKEGVQGGILEPGVAWLAPGNYHMVFKRQGTTINVQLNQDPPENSCRPAVDVMFRSAIDIYGENILAVILTGMGQDGFVGCELIKDAGGHVIAQDEASSVVWGMPGFVAKAGLADKVLPLDQIGQELIKRCQQGRK